MQKLGYNAHLFLKWDKVIYNFYVFSKVVFDPHPSRLRIT